MPEISTLFFIYGIDNFQAEEIRKMEIEFAKELRWLDKFKGKPDEKVIERLILKSQR